MELLIGAILIVGALIGGYVLGYGNGEKEALNSRKTTFDQTLDYLTPVNNFIDTAIISEIHRLMGAYKRAENGPVFLSYLNQNSERLSEFLVKVTTVCTVNMSKNLKNSFYRIYQRDTDKKRNEESEPLLSEYVVQRAMIYIREKVVDITLKKEGTDNRALLDDAYRIELEGELRNQYGFGQVQRSKSLPTQL